MGGVGLDPQICGTFPAVEAKALPWAPNTEQDSTAPQLVSWTHGPSIWTLALEG